MKLKLALWHDRPALGGDAQKEEVDIGNLLDTHPPTKMVETLKRRVVQEHEAAWLAMRRECVKPVAREVDKSATVAQLRTAMVAASARVPDGELVRRFRRCVGDSVISVDGDLLGEECVDVGQFTDRLRRECYLELNHAPPSCGDFGSQSRSPLRGKSSRKH